MPTLTLMPFERDVVTFEQPFGCLMAGRGAGKTHAIQCRLKYRSSRFRKLRSMYITPLSVQGLEVFEEMKSDSDFKRFIKKTGTRPYPSITLKNGSRIWYRSFQRPSGIRSTGEDEVYIDEVQDECYTEHNVDTVVIPLIGRRNSPAGGRGILLVSGQFRGDNYLKRRYYDPGQELTGDGKVNPLYNPRVFRSWRVPSSDGWSYQTPGGAERLALIKASTPISAWEQEWDCIPTANQNAVYRPAMVDSVSIGRTPRCLHYSLNQRWDGGPTVTAVDIGEIVDYSAVCVVDVRGCVVFCEQFPARQDHRISAARAAAVAAHFRSMTLMVDATGGGKPGQSSEEFTALLKMYRDAAQARGVDYEPFFFSSKKKALVVNLEVAMQEGKLGIPAEGCEDLIAEIKAYEYKYNPKTKWYFYGAPRGQHDDRLGALLMAWNGFERGLAGNLVRYKGAM